jgi:hypothetical protein
MADEITLTIPREPDFHRVAHLVLGGLAARLNLTVENLEDLQLAVDSILERAEMASGDVTVRMSVRDDELEARVGPLGTRLLDELADADAAGLGLRRVLDSTVDRAEADGDWIVLTKRVDHDG